MLVCVLYFTVYVYVCVQTNVCVPSYSAKGIDDVRLIRNKIDWLIDFKIFAAAYTEQVGHAGNNSEPLGVGFHHIGPTFIIHMLF